MRTVKTKYCKRCDRVLPVERFSKHKNTKDGLNFYCRGCISEKGKIYRKTAISVYNFMKHDVRKRKPVLVSKDDFVEWYDRQPKVCVYCGIEEKQLKQVKDSFNNVSIKLTVDCKDNKLGYVKENLVFACRRCNWVKSDFFTYEQMLEIGLKYIKSEWEKQLNKDI